MQRDRISNKEIANHLKAAALDAPEELNDDAPRFEVTFGATTIRCRNTRPAILKVAEKFGKNRRFTTFSQPRATVRREGPAVLAKRYKHDAEMMANLKELFP